ncbi:MAG: membrane protein insertase YidC [Candidatus Dormibacteraeota bacterium]|nr:membrane protein insertase YidC [Candidatus Dormibacteraeota bacterium]MBV9526636.1 membrane protein insertase YidC [Candidatus Dormibacteraeota bacterium]
MNPLVIFTFLTSPFQWLLEQMTKAFAGIPSQIGAFGVAVIVLTVLIRAVLFPIFSWQLRTSRRIQAEQRLIAPQLAELRKKYRKEPQKLSAEMNKVYKEHGISPFSGLMGCVPALVQMPVLIGLYNSIRQATTHLAQNHIDIRFLWIPDVSKSVVANGNFAGILSDPAGLVLPAIAAAFTFAQSRMMMPPPRPDMTDQERSMANVTRQMSILFPGMVFFFGLLLPQGLAIYWVTGTIFMVLQQFIVVGWGGLNVPAWWPGANRVTPLSYPRAAPSAALVSANGDKKRRAYPESNGTEKTAEQDDDAERGAAAGASASSRMSHPSGRSRARGRRGGQRRRRR